MKETITELMARIAQEAWQSQAAMDSEAAIQDAFVYGAGWIMVDKSGKMRHVKPADVLTWKEELQPRQE